MPHSLSREQMLVDVNTASRILSLSKSYLYREVRKGRLPAKRIGSRVLFKMTDLAAWVDTQTSNSWPRKL